MLTFSFSIACLYWANSYEAHKSKTDSWVTAVKSVLLQNKCDQPSPKSYDNSNARFSFHEMCQLCYCVVPYKSIEEKLSKVCLSWNIRLSYKTNKEEDALNTKNMTSEITFSTFEIISIALQLLTLIVVVSQFINTQRRLQRSSCNNNTKSWWLFGYETSKIIYAWNATWYCTWAPTFRGLKPFWVYI